MDSIRERFLQAEQDFLFAARSDSQLLVDFAERWQALQSEWESCLHKADRQTQQLVDEVATRIEGLAVDLYAVQSHRISLEEDLLSGLEDVFASLSLEDQDIGSTGPTSSEAPPPAEYTSVDCCALSPAEWLLHNLHNPYPLPHTRFSSNQTMGSKHVKDWFSKARQRIGWTRLLRDRFAGCRSLATDAAFRAFVRDDPSNPLDTDLKTAFLAIKSHAELVYGDGGVNSPSSKRSRSISPTPSLTYSLSSEDTDDERFVLPTELNSTRPPKRLSSQISDFPSPKRRRTCESKSSPASRTEDASSPYAETQLLRPSKRRLSESDSNNPRPKRPKGMEGGRLHAVSDSLCGEPARFSFDQSFQLPNPASTQPLNLSSFELDFFNPSPPPPCVTSPIPAPFSNNTCLVDDFSALFEMPQIDLLQPTLLTFDSDWTEFLNLEPDLSLFPSSPSLASSSTDTPPLVDDATLSPSSPFCSDPSSPGLALEILPPLNKKGVQLPIVGGPIIRGPDFLLPPGENAGIPSTSALLSVH